MSKRDELLQTLFDISLEELIKRIKSGDAKPADLECARKFLSDNGIDATPEAKPNLGLLSGLANYAGPDDYQ